MKKSFLFLAFGFMTLATYAVPKVLTVYNGTGIKAQYTNLDDAIAAAVDGDTIMLYGSPNPYGITGTWINKQLIIIGPGWKPDNNGSGGYAAAIGSGIGVNNALTFEGISFDSFVYFYAAGAGTEFIRCRFNSEFNLQENCNGLEIRGCYFSAGSWLYAQNQVVKNFIFVNNYCFFNTNGFYQFSSTSNANILIDHNLFYGSTNGIFQAGTTKFTLTNNIFVNNNITDISNSTFSRNVCYNTSGGSTPWTVNGNIDGGGNLITDPQMMSQVAVNGNTNDASLDFTIVSGSLAKGTASDGKDIGLLYDAVSVSTDNFANCRLSRLPYVSSANIQSSSVNQGTNIVIDVVGKRAF